jgi:hypothetical protein
MLLENGMFTVRLHRKFMQGSTIYNEGEVAGFSPDVARRLTQPDRDGVIWGEDYKVAPAHQTSVSPHMVAVSYATEEMHAIVGQQLNPLVGVVEALTKRIEELEARLKAQSLD